MQGHAYSVWFRRQAGRRSGLAGLGTRRLLISPVGLPCVVGNIARGFRQDHQGVDDHGRSRYFNTDRVSQASDGHSRCVAPLTNDSRHGTFPVESFIGIPF